MAPSNIGYIFVDGWWCFHSNLGYDLFFEVFVVIPTLGATCIFVVVQTLAIIFIFVVIQIIKYFSVDSEMHCNQKNLLKIEKQIHNFVFVVNAVFKRWSL